MPFDGQIPLEPCAPPREPGCIRAVILYNPLDPNDRTIADIAWEPGKTVAEYLEGLPEDVTWTVGAAGRLLPQEEWGEVTLVEDDAIILSVTPEKGGQGMMIVAALVIAVASAGAASWASGAILAAGYGVGAAAVGAAVVGAAISVGGMLLMNALFPPTAAAKGGDQDATDSPSYSLSGPTSTATENVPVPLVYGEFEVGGNRINAYTQNSADGKAQWLLLQYAVSEGPIESISDLKINDQPASNFRDVQFDWRPGDLGQSQLGWFIDVPTTYADGRTITQTPITYTTVDAVDRIQLDLSFPNGLISIDEKKGDRRPSEATVRAVATPVAGGPSILLQGSHWADAGIVPGGGVTEAGIGIRVIVAVNGADGTDSSTPFAASCSISQSTDAGYFEVLNQTRTGRIANNYRAPSSWAAGQELLVFEFTQNDLNILVDRNWAVAVAGGSVQSVQVLKLGAARIERQEKNAFTVTLDSGAVPRGRYYLSVYRDDPESTSDYVINRVVLNSIKEIQADPVRYNRTAFYALRVRMTEQLNSLPKTTVKVRGRKVNIYDRNGNLVVKQWSNNPADVALDLLLSPDSQRTLPPSRIDFPWFARFRQHCVNNNLTFNGIFDYMTNTWDALVQVLRVGRASPVAAGLKWSGVIEAPSEPVMMFGAQNIIKGSFRNNWLARTGRANSVEGQYYDKNDGYKQRSVFAIDYAALARGDDLVQASINLIGVTDPVQAQAEVDLQLRMNQYLVQGCSFRTGLDALGCTIGDVIYVQHDMPKWGWGDRVRSVGFNQIEVYNPMLGQETGEAPLPVLDGEDLVIPPGPLFPEGDWRVLVLKPAVLRAAGTVTAQSGAQITVSGAISTDFKISRVKIGGEDFGVLDTVRFTTTTAFVLDRSPGSVTGLTAELWQTDVMLEGSIARPSENDTVLNLTSWTHGYTAEPGDQVLIGRVGKFKKPFRIIKIGRDANHQRSVECMEYVPQVYDPTGQYPDNDYSELSAFPLHVGSLTADQVTMDVNGGGVRYLAKATWQAPLNDVRGHAGAAVWVSIGTGNFELHERVPVGRSFSQIEAQIDQVVRFRVIAYDESGASAPLSTAPIAAVTIGRRFRAPAAPTGLAAFGGIRLVGLSWVRPDDADIKLYEVFENTTGTFDTAYKVGESATPTFTRHGLPPRVTRFYWVRSVSYAGEISVTPAGPVSALTDWLIASDIADGILNTAKFAAGIKPVALPTNSTELNNARFEDQIVYPQNDIVDPVTGQTLLSQRLYRWTGTQWSSMVSAPEIEGQLTDGQIANLNANKLEGNLNAALFPTNLRPVEVVDALPATGNFQGRTVLLRSDNKLYRHTGSPANATGFIATVPASDIAGTITSTQIADNAITTPKLTANAITADKIQANAITAGKIATDAITAGNIQAGAITAAKIAADSIGASKIVIGDTANTYPDFDMLDAGYYASSLGSAFTLTGTSAANTGRQLLTISPSLLVGKVESDWFTIENNADYAISGVASVTDTVSGVMATLEIELGSMGSAGAITSTRTLQVAQTINSAALARQTITLKTSNTERRARFVMHKNEAGVASARFGGFIVRRRANGELIVDGSISADKIAAGAITTEKLSVGSPNNIIYNSCFAYTKSGWVEQIGGSLLSFQDANWRTSQGSGVIFGGALPGGAYRDIYWAPGGVVNRAVQASPGEVWEGQAKLIPLNGVSGQIYLGFYNAAGTILAYSPAGYVAPSAVTDGKTLDRYTTAVCRATAPANTAYVSLLIRMINETGATIAGPAMIMTQTLLGRTVVGATAPLVWTAGGVTEISGDMIRSASITADAIAANAITADKIAANSIIAGKIAAGAISSDQIAAGQIRAVNLASETLITQAAQIGTAVITSAKIGDLEVGTLKIAENAITSITNGMYVSGSPAQNASVNVVNGDPFHAARYLISASWIGRGGTYFVSDGEGTVPVYAPLTIRIFRNGGLLFAWNVDFNTTMNVYEYLGPSFYTWTAQADIDSNVWGNTGTAGTQIISLQVTKVIK